VVEHPVRPERWGVCLRQQKNVFFDALLYKKHPKLYRERILHAPPWDYYLIVALTLAAPALGPPASTARRRSVCCSRWPACSASPRSACAAPR
jgi:hypothetical protein